MWIKLDYFYRHQQPGTGSCATEWNGAKHRQGYGMMGALRKSDGKRIMTVVHRIAARLKLGRALQPGENVMRTCSNPLCLDFAHIEVGSLSLRNEIMYRNCRGNSPGRGPSTGQKQYRRQYKYSEAEIEWVRRANTQDIAARYNISRGAAARRRHDFQNGYKWLPFTKETR
jgi:hypothetical protein